MNKLRKAIHKYLDENEDKSDIKTLWIPHESLHELFDFDGSELRFENASDVEIALSLDFLVGHFTDGLGGECPVHIDPTLKPNQFIFEYH